MNKFKRLLSCGLATAMVLSMTACGDEPAPSTSKPSGGVGGVGNVGEQAAATSMVTAATAASTTRDPDSDAPTDKEIKDIDTGTFTPDGKSGTVKFLGYYDITVDQKGAEQVDVFESETYGGKIEWTSCSSGAGYYEKLATLIAADDSPDLLTFEPLAFPYGASKNMFEPLDGYLNADDPIWAEMKPLIDSYVYEGKHYYFPHRMTTSFALNYNKKTIEDAGLQDPYELYVNGQWTWDAWREMMITFCNQDDENIGFYATNTIINAFINTTGNAIMDSQPDGSVINNLQDANTTRAVEYLSELGRNGLLYPADHPHGDWVSPQVWAPISDKLLFLGMEPEWTYIAATEEIQNPSGVDNDILDTVSDFAFVPFPRDPEADQYYQGSGTFGYMIPKGAKNIKGSIDFIMCNRLFDMDEGVKAQVRNDHIAPAKVTYTSGKYEGRQKWVINWDPVVYDLWREMCDPTKFTFVIEDLYGFSTEMETTVCDALYSSTFGEESWTQKVGEIAPIVDGILAEYAD